MGEFSFNLWAILVCAVLQLALGGAWYSIWSKPWMTALGINLNDVEDADMSLGAALIATFVSGVVLAVVLSAVVTGLGINSPGAGAAVGALAWLGFNLTSAIKLHFWEDRPWTLIWIDGGCDLLAFSAVGAVLVWWS